MDFPPVHLINETGNYRVYRERFWVLFIFFFHTFNQCMFWLTFSPIAAETMSYYQTSEANVDLLLNWGPIIFLPALPLVYVLVNTHHGLRRCILLYALILIVGTALRLVPFLITSSDKPNFHDVSLPFLHVAQILIATTGPIAMALVSQLSCIWFAPHERTRATTMAILAAELGGAVALLISPFLVTQASEVPRLLYLHIGQALVACVLTLIYFPAEPPTPPSLAAEMLRANQLASERSIETLKKILWDIWLCIQNLPAVLLIISGAILGGTFGVWSGIFATILTPLGYTEIQAGERSLFIPIEYLSFCYLPIGWFGFSQTIAGIIGSFIMSYVADHRRFQRSFKPLILISLILSFIFCLLFQFSVRTLFWPNKALMPSTPATIGILLSITGFFYGAGFPLFYESLAEVTHPLPESSSTSLLVQVFNLTSVIFIAIAPNRYKLMNLLVLLVIGISIIMVACTRMTYRRKDKESRKIEEQLYEIQ